MMYGFAKKFRKQPSWKQLEHAVLRNFGGLEKLDPVHVFRRFVEDLNMDQSVSSQDDLFQLSSIKPVFIGHLQL